MRALDDDRDRDLVVHGVRERQARRLDRLVARGEPKVFPNIVRRDGDAKHVARLRREKVGRVVAPACVVVVGRLHETRRADLERLALAHEVDAVARSACEDARAVVRQELHRIPLALRVAKNTLTRKALVHVKKNYPSVNTTR